MAQSTLACNLAMRHFLYVRSNLGIALHQRTTSVLGAIADNSPGFVSWPGPELSGGMLISGIPC